MLMLLTRRALLYFVLPVAVFVVATMLIVQYGDPNLTGQWWFRWYGMWIDAAGPGNIQWSPICSRNYC